MEDTLTPPPTVHVVDDDASFLQALSRLLRASGYAVKTYTSAREFLNRCDGDAPGCVVADLRMPEVDGLALQAELARTAQPLPLLFLTGHAQTVATVRAMRAGAEDFLEKRAPKEQLLEAVQRALARDVQERAARARQQALRSRFATLTAREREVLQHVLQGRLNKQIAADLGIHERTVKIHRKSLMTKLEVRSVAALVRLVPEAGEPAPPATFP